MHFLDKICRREAASGLVIGVYQFLINLYEMITFSYGAELLFSNLRNSLVFEWILSRAYGYPETKCWLEVAKFLDALFRRDDLETSHISLKVNVSPVVDKTLGNSPPQVCTHVLKVVVLLS